MHLPTLAQARDALDQGRGKGVRIAVIDSGVEVSHPELAGLRLSDDIQVSDAGVKLDVRTGDGTDIFGHGTAICWIIRKTAPEAEIGSFRVLGETLCSRTVIIREGVRQAIDRGYHILNCSFGCGMINHILDYKEWIDEAYLKGIHVVAACNNNDFRRPEWPGYFPSVITVNMVDIADENMIIYKAGHLVEFAALGVNVRVPWLQGRVKEVTGSSFAAPRVAGLLARMLSSYPHLSPLEAKSLLHRLASPWTPETNVLAAM
jgi:subtilisin